MQAVILAGGRGSRLAPITDSIPKPMVEINGKPLLWYIIKLLRENGFYDIIFCLGYKYDKIVNYVGSGKALEILPHFSIEQEPLGSAGGVKAAEKYIKDDFLVISGDAYCDINLSRVVAFHNSTGGMGTLVGKHADDARGFGLIRATADGRILRFEEKPIRRIEGIVNTGIYMFNREILKHIMPTKQDFALDVFPRVLDRLYCYRTTEHWEDVGTPETLARLNHGVIVGSV